MNGINLVILVGTIGAEPNFRTTQGGTNVLSLRIATTTSKWNRAEGKATEHTQWHNVTVFGPRAEALSRFLRNGQAVAVRGELSHRSYDKNGVKMYATDVIAEDISVPPSGGQREHYEQRSQGTDSRRQRSSYGRESASAQDDAFADTPSQNSDDDQLPF
jgi:single-strand DNA-binding protein